MSVTAYPPPSEVSSIVIHVTWAECHPPISSEQTCIKLKNGGNCWIKRMPHREYIQYWDILENSLKENLIGSGSKAILDHVASLVTSYPDPSMVVSVSRKVRWTDSDSKREVTTTSFEMFNNETQIVHNMTLATYIPYWNALDSELRKVLIMTGDKDILDYVSNLGSK